VQTGDKAGIFERQGLYFRFRVINYGPVTDPFETGRDLMKTRVYETSPDGCADAGPVKRLRGRPAAFMSAILAIVLCLPLVLSAGERDTVRVGYYENEVFQEGAREGVMKSGYAYEYYRKMSEYTGWKYEYVYGSYAELYQMLLDGRIDLLAGLAKKSERLAVIGYPQAPMGSESYNLVKHGGDESITANPRTLAGKTIGVLDCAVADVLKQFLAGMRVPAKVVTYKDCPALFAAFDSGELDVLAAEGNGAAGRDDTEVLMPFGGSSYFLCVNIRRPDLLAQLNKAQAALLVEDPNFLHGLNIKYYPRTILARAVSQIERQWLKTHRTLRIGYLENYMPYSGKDANGQVSGVVRDLIPEILEKLGISLEVVYTGYASYDAMTAALAAGRIDAAFPVGGGLYFFEKDGLSPTVPVTAMPAELVYKGHFTEKTTAHFAINENNLLQYYIMHRNCPKAKVSTYPSIRACLNAVVSGEVDCTVLNGLRAPDILKNREYQGLSRHQLIGQTDECCIGVKIGNKGLLTLLNRGLGMIENDYVQKRSHLYVHTLYSYQLEDIFFDHLGLFASLLLAVGAVIIVLLARDIRRTRRQMAEKEAAGVRLAETNRDLMERTRTIEMQRRQEAELRELLEKKQGELEDALQLAQSANRAKTTFLSNMSHDIRTPMNAILGFTELAAGNIHETERVQEYLETIAQSSEHLLSLINDVLDMSRIESGRMTLNEKEESLADIVHMIRELVHADVRAKGLDFGIVAEGIRNERVYCDRLRLNQVLLNLLSNAVKYTDRGGSIRLRIAQKPAAKADFGAYEFRVKDNGIGMSEQFAETVFEPFTREENSTVSGIQGTGLGMAITKNIVEMMGGRISVTSKKGEGSEFVVSLEFRIADGNTAELAIPELKGARALAALADADACRNMADMLRELGMRSEWCVSGREAVARAEAAAHGGDGFAVAVVDRRMPDMDGLETVRGIRKSAGKDTRILLLTAYDRGDIEKAAGEAGVTGFVSQPVFPSDLRKALVKFTGKADPGRTAREGSDFSLKGKKVLLVDDSKLNLKIGVLLLQREGMIVDTASNGQVAVDRIEEKGIGAYDFILMDVQMPVMGGYEATAALRKLPGGEKLKIFAFSANAFEEDREKSLKAGMNGHITKPLKIDDLVNLLARASAND